MNSASCPLLRGELDQAVQGGPWRNGWGILRKAEGWHIMWSQM